MAHIAPLSAEMASTTDQTYPILSLNTLPGACGTLCSFFFWHLMFPPLLVFRVLVQHSFSENIYWMNELLPAAKAGNTHARAHTHTHTHTHNS